MKEKTNEIQTLIDEADRVMSRGYPARVDPAVADHMGFFRETALTEQEAIEAMHDANENGIVITGEED